MNPNRNRRTYMLAGGAVLLLALLLPRFIVRDDASGGGGGGAGSGRAGGPIRVHVEVVRTAVVGGTVSAVGTVLSNEEVQVRSQVSGQIERIAFGEGARVAKGAILVKINDDELQAQLVRARARLAIAEQQAERQKQLFEKQFVSREEYNISVNELNAVRADAQLIGAQIAKTEIRAPFDGTIGLRFVSEGSYVSPAAVITTLQDNSRMKIDFTVPEKYSTVVGEGDSVTFTIQTRPDTFSAKIYSTDSRIDETTRTLRVRAAAPNPKRALLPGSFANVQLALNPRRSLTVPAHAVIPEARGHRVFLLKQGMAESRPVAIGERDGDRVEITSGLADGDTLVTSAILQLREGMPIAPDHGGGAGAGAAPGGGQ